MKSSLLDHCPLLLICSSSEDFSSLEVFTTSLLVILLLEVVLGSLVEFVEFLFASDSGNALRCLLLYLDIIHHSNREIALFTVTVSSTFRIFCSLNRTFIGLQITRIEKNIASLPQQNFQIEKFQTEFKGLSFRFCFFGIFGTLRPSEKKD